MMLLETTAYEDDFPISIDILSIDEYPIHYHRDIEIIYVLKGNLQLRNGYCCYSLREGDVFTNTGHEVHALYSDGQDNVTAVLHVSNLFFTQFFPDLTKSCYRTYSSKEWNPKLDEFKLLILNILLTYMQKNINYKQRCIDLTLDLINMLNSNFNLFAFNDQIVENFDNENPVIRDRISHVISYLYENHYAKISLEDLAEMEHLSTYYLSHMIKKYTGISFRDFLSLARAEWSEIYLLDTDKKISTIAREVGFSTTDYYEKAFFRWFNRTPAEHRAQFGPRIKSLNNPPKVDVLPVNKAISLIKASLSISTSFEQNSNRANNLHLEIKVYQDMSVIMNVDHRLEITVTPEDWLLMGDTVFENLRTLKCGRINIPVGTDESSGLIDEMLRESGTRGIEASVSKTAAAHQNAPMIFGYDSLAGAIHVYNKELLNKESLLQVQLRDQGDTSITLKGRPSLLTSSCIPKPCFSAYDILAACNGKLVCWGKYYSVIELPGRHPAYIITAYNYNDDINNLCLKSSTLYEVEDTIAQFNDELNLSFSIDLHPGRYFVSRYTLNSNNTVFDLMSKLDFPKVLQLEHDARMRHYSSPQMDIYTETISDSISIDFDFRGIGFQTALIQKIIEDEK